MDEELENYIIDNIHDPDILRQLLCKGFNTHGKTLSDVKMDDVLRDYLNYYPRSKMFNKNSNNVNAI